MAKQNYDDSKGKWVTISGRRVFIKYRQSLSEAMSASGKFENEKLEHLKKHYKNYGF